MIRLIDIEIILARRREGRQEQANRRRRRRRQVWTREWLQRRVMFGQYDTLLHELNREDPSCYKNFLRVDADDVNRLKWSEGLGGPFCILAGDSFWDFLLLWRHYVASTLLFQGGSR